MTQAFSLGNRVVNRALLDTAVHEMGGTSITPRLIVGTIIERQTYECCGGIQYFYVCEMIDGSRAKFAEGSLMLVEEAWPVWIEAFGAQQQRLAALGKA